MKNKYPIKYAVIPMEEQISWSQGLNELEREYKTVCYIVSKCYLVEERKKYNSDGKINTTYHVVCPYEYDEFYKWNKIEPSYNLMDNKCTNYVVVDEVYENIEEAKKSKDKKNEELLQNKFIYMPTEVYKKYHEKIESEFERTLDYYNGLEYMIERSIEDLNEDIVKSKVIRLGKR